MFTKMISGTKAATSYMQIDSNPVTLEAVTRNQQIRHDLLINVLTNISNILPADIIAVKQFWATQTCVLINLLKNRQNLFVELDLDVNAVQMTKDTLIELVNSLINVLEIDTDRSRLLIDSIISDSHSPLPDVEQMDGQSSYKTSPSLFIQNGNSIEFAYEQVAMGRKILIMDAANAQRPGAGGYEKGTFQEALTRSSDLYWKILADFRDVLAELPTEKKCIIDEGDITIDVLSYQRRYLSFILFFIKKSIENPTYFEGKEFRREFFNHGNRIYNQMQNVVFEIPIDGGFIKNCQVIYTNNIHDTNELFDNGILKDDIVERIVGRVLISEVAAPDKREREGVVDRSCSFDLVRQKSDQDEIANPMVRDAIRYTLGQAILQNVDTIILNAFGCRAFKNNPVTVAIIFAEELLKFQSELSGKSIFFMDLNPDMCHQFGSVFNRELGESFNINPLLINHCHVNIMLNYFKADEKSDEIFVKASSQDPPSSNIIHIAGLNKSRKNIFVLQQAYQHSLESAIAEHSPAIHFTLLGAGKLGHWVGNSVEAFITSIEAVSEENPGLNGLKIYLHVPDPKNYQAVIQRINKRGLFCFIQQSKKEELTEHDELIKYYTIVVPDFRKQRVFTGGHFLTEHRSKHDAGHWKTLSQISDRLFLGKIPAEYNVNTLLEKIPSLKMIVSAVEDFELSSEGLPFITPSMQTGLKWSQRGIAHLQISVDDTKKTNDFPMRELIRTVVKMHEVIESGDSVYVHCKAGRSRSATVVLLYLYLYGDQANNLPPCSPLANIHGHLIEKRQEVSLHEHNYQAVSQAIKLSHERKELLEPEQPYYKQHPDLLDLPLTEQINAYLASNKAKFDIVQLCWFKELKSVAIKNKSARKGIQDFLNTILHAENGEWAISLFNDEKDLSREMKGFRDDLLNLLADQLNQNIALIPTHFHHESTEARYQMC